jgi:TRAP-type C4-dicarboxylate transport system permease small subunit
MFNKVVTSISKTLVMICAIAVLIWVLVISAYIASRMLGQSWVFAEECTGYLFVFIGYFSLAYGVITGVHVNAGVISSRIPKSASRIVQICVDIVSACIVSWLVYRSLDWVFKGIRDNVHSESALHVLMWPIYCAIPIGLTLLVLVLIIKIIQQFKTKET